MNPINYVKSLLHSKNKVIKGIRERLLLITPIENFVFKANMSDEEYIKRKYKERFGVYPNLTHPMNFNEKNNWRKLHDRKDIYTSMVDKYKIKKIISERVGNQYTFPLLGVWNRPEQIDWNSLPEKFVLKCNHSGGILVCKDKRDFDKKKGS